MDISNTMNMSINENTDLGNDDYVTASEARKNASVPVVDAFAAVSTGIHKVVVVSKILVGDVVEAAKKALYTGHIGDGKIFVYGVERVVKVRTGEEGFAALQDVE